MIVNIRDRLSVINRNVKKEDPSVTVSEEPANICVALGAWIVEQ